jgi:hypothetical protein
MGGGGIHALFEPVDILDIAVHVVEPAVFAGKGEDVDPIPVEP